MDRQAGDCENCARVELADGREEAQGDLDGAMDWFRAEGGQVVDAPGGEGECRVCWEGGDEAGIEVFERKRLVGGWMGVVADPWRQGVSKVYP